MHKPLRQILIALAVLVALGSILYVDNQRSQTKSVLSGFFESQPTDVSSRIAGKVSSILVNEGDEVQKGETLLVLDDAPDQSQLDSKRDNARQLMEQLQELKNGPRPQDIQKQQAAVAEASANLNDLLAGSRPSEIAAARAAAAAAYATYAAAVRGPVSEETAEAKAQLENAKAAYAFAQKDAVRYANLYALDAVTKQQNDQAQAAFDEANANVQNMEQAYLRSVRGTPADELEESRQTYLKAKAELATTLAGSRSDAIIAAKARLAEARAGLNELLAGTRPEDLIQARLAYDSAEDLYQSMKIDVADHRVVAPFAGQVDNVPVSNGDLVTPGTALLRLDNPNDIWIKVYIPESELANVTIGAGALLRVDGISSPLSAYVQSVDAHGEFTPANLQSPDERGKQVFGVRLRLKNEDPRVKSGMDATVTRIGTWTP